MDCAFTKDDKWFRYKACAIIVQDEHVLFAPNKLMDIYYAVGEAIKVGETAEEAVVREVSEETSIKYEIDHLAEIHENFFKDNDGNLKNLYCHEIALYFVMKSKKSQILNSNSYVFGVKENIVWLPINDLDKYNAYPRFVKQYLEPQYSSIEHIISKYA